MSGDMKDVTLLGCLVGKSFSIISWQKKLKDVLIGQPYALFLFLH